MRKVYNFLLCCFISCSLHASSGCNGTLRGNALSNEFIVVGELTKIIENTNSIIVIEFSVYETLKGELEESVLQINLSNYQNEGINLELMNSKFIVFFNNSSENNISYFVTNVCTLISMKNTSKAMLERTKEIIYINEIKNSLKRKIELIDWSIKCLGDEKTIGNGLTELSKRGFLYKENKRTNLYGRKLLPWLKRKQKKAILSFFLNRENFGHNEVFILDLIETGNKKLVLDKMSNQLKLYDSSKMPWFKEFNLMQEVARLSNDNELQKIVDQIETIGYYSMSEKIKKLTIQFISLLTIKEAS